MRAIEQIVPGTGTVRARVQCALPLAYACVLQWPQETEICTTCHEHHFWSPYRGYEFFGLLLLLLWLSVEHELLLLLLTGECDEINFKREIRMCCTPLPLPLLLLLLLCRLSGWLRNFWPLMLGGGLLAGGLAIISSAVDRSFLRINIPCGRLSFRF